MPSPENFVQNLFLEFCQSKGFEEIPTHEPDLKNMIEGFNRQVPKYHWWNQQVVEIRLMESDGMMDVKVHTPDNFVIKMNEFESATELYVTRKESETRIYLVISALLLIGLSIIWLIK